jgi:lipopolysaccharide biosynthesis protein
MKPAVAVFCHLFYPDSYPDLVWKLRNIGSCCLPVYFFNVVDSCSNSAVVESIRNDFPGAFIISTPNIGKDVGGKLALMELYLKLDVKSEFLILLHDKKSPELLNGRQWRDELLKITEAEHVPGIIKMFSEELDTGLIGAAEHISNEYKVESGNFASHNDQLLKKYIAGFGLKNKDYMFLAGNMFWVRSLIFEAFFRKHSPLVIRTQLEKGNMSDVSIGTHTHSLERIFSWIALDQGYKVKGI